MMNKEKFKALVSNEKTNTVERNRERIKNRARLRESQNIALKVLIQLDELGWTQKKLAKEMGVAPQQITKIVSGKENLTLQTQTALQDILNIPILASYYEKMIEQIVSSFKVSDTEKYTKPINHFYNLESEILLPKKVFKMEYDSETKDYNHYQQTA